MPRGSRALKLLDRYVGIPVVGAFAWRRKRARPAALARIGLMKTAAIGDTLLLAGIVDDVAAAFPAARVVLVTGEDNSAAGELVAPRVDRIVISATRPFAAARRIRALQLDALIDFGSWPRLDALLSAFSGATYTVGFRTAGQRRHYAYDAVVDHSSALHERDNYLRLVAALGVTPSTPPRVDVPAPLPAALVPRPPFVVFHPRAGGYRHEVKEWPRERWVELAKALAGDGTRILISGSTADRDHAEALARAVAALGIPVENVAGRYTLAQLAGVFALSEAVVCVNTGVAHLAGLVGARTVTLEGPTPPARWRPLGPRVRAVESVLPNCGYLNLGFEYAGQRLDCMTGVGVDAVVNAIAELRGR